MDIRISGAGTVSGGEYDDVRITGAASLRGAVRCASLSCSGALKGEGSVTCAETAQISGSVKIDGTVQAKNVRVSGALSCEGVLAEGCVELSGGTHVGGSLTGGSVSASGGLRVGGGIEANAFTVTGSLDCGGLLNAERIEIRLGSANSTVQAIGGGSVEVTLHPVRAGKSILSSIFGGRAGKNGTLRVREYVEADDVSLVNTVCPAVTGARVVIGPGCEIDVVRYTESCRVDPAARVKQTLQVEA